MDYGTEYQTKSTPPHRPIPGKNMVQNEDKAYVFKADSWDRLDRFLILGSEGGSYYAGQHKLTVDNCDNVVACIKEDGIKVVQTIMVLSTSGRAPKNDPAIFALALACTFGNEATKKDAYATIAYVCRTGTHLFTFMEAIQKLRKWSRGLKTGVAAFYNTRNAEAIGYQLIKYRQRNGWTHKDVLRLCHAKPVNEKVDELFKFAVGKKFDNFKLPEQVQAFLDVQKTENPKFVIECISKYDLPREAIPTEMLDNKEVWEALLEKMPMTALVRNLGKLSSMGLIDNNFSQWTKHTVDMLTNQEAITKSRLHPLQVLVAMKMYEQGRGMKGSLEWQVSTQVVDALEDCFYKAFGNVKKTNKNYLLGIDISGSMDYYKIAGMPISPAVAAACMAMVTARTEPMHEMMGFGHEFVKLGITPRSTLNHAMKQITNQTFGSTDCSLPMEYAIKHKLPIDAFIVYTDNQMNTGRRHPVQALEDHRQKSGRNAKLIVCAMTSGGFTIADPDDAGMLDVVGFDTATPNVISQFISG